MKVKNNSSFPKKVSGIRIEPGETKEVPETTDFPSHVEVIEKSGDSGSDQNTKQEKPESEKDDNGGE